MLVLMTVSALLESLARPLDSWHSVVCHPPAQPTACLRLVGSFSSANLGRSSLCKRLRAID
jgi:hypothetical protein